MYQDQVLGGVSPTATRLPAYVPKEVYQNFHATFTRKDKGLTVVLANIRSDMESLARRVNAVKGRQIVLEKRQMQLESGYLNLKEGQRVLREDADKQKKMSKGFQKQLEVLMAERDGERTTKHNPEPIEEDLGGWLFFAQEDLQDSEVDDTGDFTLVVDHGTTDGAVDCEEDLGAWLFANNSRRFHTITDDQEDLGAWLFAENARRFSTVTDDQEDLGAWLFAKHARRFSTVIDDQEDLGAWLFADNAENLAAGIVPLQVQPTHPCCWCCRYMMATFVLLVPFLLSAIDILCDQPTHLIHIRCDVDINPHAAATATAFDVIHKSVENCYFVDNVCVPDVLDVQNGWVVYSEEVNGWVYVD